MAQEDADLVRHQIDELFARAIAGGASDIHFNCLEDGCVVRFRVDGCLHDVQIFAAEETKRVISRVKVMAELDIAKQRRMQESRFRHEAGGKQIDLRVSLMPTLHGQNLVLRLLDPAQAFIPLERIGMAARELSWLEEMVHKPNGIVLVTGPTGSGKTTTMYAVLSSINDVQRNILTIEDPIEYSLPRVNQCKVDPRAEISFVSALRHLLRHDPDVLFIGEVRDEETAQIAIRSALTGHLIFSTMHTNRAAEAVVNLIDLGVKPYLVANTLRGALAQRLIRTICPECAEKFDLEIDLLPESDRLLLQAEGLEHSFSIGRGCNKCYSSGYLGRTGIFELLSVSSPMARLIHNGAPLGELEAQARREGTITLREAGLRLVAQGRTTIEEVLRVVDVPLD